MGVAAHSLARRLQLLTNWPMKLRAQPPARQSKLPVTEYGTSDRVSVEFYPGDGDTLGGCRQQKNCLAEVKIQIVEIGKHHLGFIFPIGRLHTCQMWNVVVCLGSVESRFAVHYTAPEMT